MFDTSMVHTETHLENATTSWWRVRGLNHRHNVQPFGCPYIGMRGSYPSGHRILRHLAGGGVIGDGLDLVAKRDRAGNAILTEERAADAISVTAVKIDGRPAERVAVAVDPPRGSHVAGFGFRIPLPLSGNGRWTHVTAPGSFRLERWLLDQREEQIPGWLNSDSRTRWPLWRGGGILLLPDGAYRIFKQNRIDTSPLFVDQGVGSPGWLDLTDRGGKQHWGVTVRPLPGSAKDSVRSVRVDIAGKRLVVALHSPAGAPLPASAGPFSGAADVIRHDGRRPPLGPPDLTREQLRRFLDDLDYGGNIGLFALRFLLAPDHRVPPGPWKQRLADTGVEPRELLLPMQWKGGLAKHCERIGARFDPKTGVHTRRGAARALGKALRETDLPPPVLESARARLLKTFDRDRDLLVKAYAAIAMGGTREPFGVAVLSRKVERGSCAVVRPFAALALALAAGRLDADRAAEIRTLLVKELGETNDLDLSVALCIAVGLSGAEDGRKLLLERAGPKQKNPEVRAPACQALGLLGPHAGTEEFLRATLDDSSDAVVEKAAIGLGLIGGRESARAIISKLVNAKSERVQGHLVIALGHLGGTPAIEPLVEVLADPAQKTRIRESAAAALGVLVDPREVDPLFEFDALVDPYALTAATRVLFLVY